MSRKILRCGTRYDSYLVPHYNFFSALHCIQRTMVNSQLDELRIIAHDSRLNAKTLSTIDNWYRPVA